MVDVFVYGGYLAVWAAFSATLYATMVGAHARNKGVENAREVRKFYVFIAIAVASAWPVTLVVCTVLATASIMAERKR